MSRQQRPITDREIKAWLAAGAVDRGVGEGLTFVASPSFSTRRCFRANRVVLRSQVLDA